jgi:VIT1/CCC1 family predicted Fe2+/Mn2+ transporter
MSRLRTHTERHSIERIGWLRAAVLGANDGIVSTASLIVGVAAAAQGRQEVLLAGFAGLVAGAMSMAAGEYVSVSSQSDTERADLARERAELAADPAAERWELARIYEARGISAGLAVQVADELTARDALAAHARDELGISAASKARPVQAAVTSALTFAVGAGAPLAVTMLSSAEHMLLAVSSASLVFLASLGYVGAGVGGAPPAKAILRVTFWGAAAMAVTAAVGSMVGTTV